ncbi:fimbrial chaperone [Escherichia albertii]|uniref:fimbrial chaperone n=1 Tax=Escherichia albertii TaxID=208962 RepID=UPI001BB2307A
MNKPIKIFTTFFLFFLLCNHASAAFILNGTRFIYDEGKKNISVEVTNNSNKEYGGQLWIDNIHNNNGVYMIAQPPFFRVNAKQKQIIRVMRTNERLPEDKESLFWLNVQEIPKKADNIQDGESSLAIAMNIKVKLIYRPQSIKDGRNDAEKKLIVLTENNKTWIKNPTPYYMAIVNVKNNGRDLILSKKVQNEIACLEPFSQISLEKRINGKISIDAINDWGGVQQYEIQ